MAYGFLDLASTPSVRAAQASMGVDQHWRDFAGDRAFDRLTEREAAFISERDSFYMATAGEGGWPYVQHRGGPRGFLKCIDEVTLAFADFRGNRQYITLGNLRANDRAALILVDYANRARLKIYARTEVVSLEAEPALTQRVLEDEYKARPERIFRLRLSAFDWNCAQHITPRLAAAELPELVDHLQMRIRDLEAENDRLRTSLSASDGAGGQPGQA